MPAVIQQPLGVLFTLPGDVTYYRRLHHLPNQSLAAGLAEGLAAATHPHGPIRTESVAMQYVQTMRRMVRELHAQGFTGSISDLTSAMMVQYWLTCDYHRERRIRVVLGAYQDTIGGLDPGIHRHLVGRRINKMSKSQPNRPYSDGEWQRLTTACTETIAASHRAHRQALEAAERGADPSMRGATYDNLAWLLLRTGPVATSTVLDRVGPAARPHGDRAEIMAVHRALFPAADTAFAYITLFAMRTGIVPDGIDALTIGDITRTSANSILLSYKKGSTGGEAVTLPGDAVRLLDRWLAHSSLLREHTGDLAERMWIHVGGDSRGRGNGTVFAQPRAQARRRAWVRSTGVLGDDGQPLPVHGGRIRATYHHRRDRSTWTGRTTIDPNHSARVEGDHYLSSHTPAQLDAIEGVIEQAQGDLRRKAAPPVVVTGEGAAEFAAQFPRLVEDAGLDTATVQALLSGEQDVFVAACANPLNSPYAPAGTLCPARPWVRLLCPLAAFTPRHLPNLLRLKEYFSRQATQMTTAQFLRIFGPYAARLDDDVLPRFGPAAIDAAARQAAETAADLPLPLHLEELPL
jgi:hypothetical protein